MLTTTNNAVLQHCPFGTQEGRLVSLSTTFGTKLSGIFVISVTYLQWRMEELVCDQALFNQSLWSGVLVLEFFFAMRAGDGLVSFPSCTLWLTKETTEEHQQI